MFSSPLDRVENQLTTTIRWRGCARPVLTTTFCLHTNRLDDILKHWNEKPLIHDKHRTLIRMACNMFRHELLIPTDIVRLIETFYGDQYNYAPINLIIVPRGPMVHIWENMLASYCKLQYQVYSYQNKKQFPPQVILCDSRSVRKVCQTYGQFYNRILYYQIKHLQRKSVPSTLKAKRNWVVSDYKSRDIHSAVYDNRVMCNFGWIGKSVIWKRRIIEACSFSLGMNTPNKFIFKTFDSFTDLFCKLLQFVKVHQCQRVCIITKYKSYVIKNRLLRFGITFSEDGDQPGPMWLFHNEFQMGVYSFLNLDCIILIGSKYNEYVVSSLKFGSTPHILHLIEPKYSACNHWNSAHTWRSIT